MFVSRVRPEPLDETADFGVKKLVSDESPR